MIILYKEKVILKSMNLRGHYHYLNKYIRF